MSNPKHNRRKLEKLFDFMGKGGGVSEAARLFGISRAHVYRLIEKQERAIEKDVFTKEENPDPYSSDGVEGRQLAMCLGCRWPFFFPVGEGYHEEICAPQCLAVVQAKEQKEPEVILAIKAALKKDIHFAASSEAWEEAEKKRRARRSETKQRLNDIGDCRDLIEE